MVLPVSRYSYEDFVRSRIRRSPSGTSDIFRLECSTSKLGLVEPPVQESAPDEVIAAKLLSYGSLYGLVKFEVLRPIFGANRGRKTTAGYPQTPHGLGRTCLFWPRRTSSIVSA